jgi:two-component system OmpR family sensor kinase
MRSWAHRYWLEIAWVAWAVVNLAVTVILGNYETVPFHFVWISLTLMYGYRIWRLQIALTALGAVFVATGITLGWVVVHGPQGADELTEVPLMAAVFLAMVWHVERRRGAVLEVQRAAAREREFVRAASHHIKTPIAIARALTSLMKTQANGNGNPDLDDVIEELARLAGLADQMLLLASSEQHDALVCADIDFEDLIVGAAARRWSRTEDRRWSIVPSDGILNGDRQRLDCVLDALLDNAVRATDVGDEISIVGRAEGETAVIEISDTGVGIDHDSLPRVFERFWSGADPKSGQRGTGLGLPIVRAVVDAHGGEIEISSSTGSGTGSGTTVAIRLPNLRAADELVPVLLQD